MKQKTFKTSTLLVGLLCFLVLVSCNRQADIPQIRQSYALDLDREAILGLVDSSSFPSSYIQGSLMAIDEVNQSGILPKPIKPLVMDDEGVVSKAINIARDLSGNPEVFAVMGHLLSGPAISASIIYEAKKVLYISPSASQTDLIRQENSFIFRTIPNDKSFAKAIVKYAQRQKIQRVAIVYDREYNHRRNAELFQKEALSAGIDVQAIRSYSYWEKDFYDLFTEIKRDTEIDALYLSGDFPKVNELIIQARKMGINQTILASNVLDSQLLIDGAGKAAEGVVVATVFDPRLPSSKTRAFVNRFSARFGTPPDTWAAQGYDSIHLMAQTIKQHRSFDPSVLASGLRFIAPLNGASGEISLENSGEVKARDFHFKQVKSGNFVYFEDTKKRKVSLFESIREETLQFGTNQQIGTLDPALIQNDLEMEIAGQMFLPLVSPNSSGQKRDTELSRSLVRTGKTTYELEIQKNYFWSDGTPVTSADILAGIKRNLASKSPQVKLLFHLLNAEAYAKGEIKDFDKVGVTILDASRVRFTLKQAFSSFSQLLSHPVYWPLPSSQLKNNNDPWKTPQKLLTNGPYRLIKDQKKLVIIMRQNTFFPWSVENPIEEIRYLYIPNQQMALEMFLGKTLDILDGKLIDIDLEKINRQASLSSSIDQMVKVHEEPEVTAFAFALGQEPTNNPLIRQAISMAIDRRLISKLLTRDLHQPATGILRQGGETSEVDPFFNPQTALQLLTKAGYGPGRKILKLTIGYQKKGQKIAQGVKDSLEHYLKADINLQDLSEGGISHMQQLNLKANYPGKDALISQLNGSLAKELSWDEGDLQKRLESARQEANTDKRDLLYYQADRRISQGDTLLTPILWIRRPLLIQSRVANWSASRWGRQVIEHWKLKTSE